MLVRRLARPMLAAIFVYGGAQALRNPQAHAKAAAPVVDTVTEAAGGTLPDGVPTDPGTLVKIDGGIKIGAGLLLAAGRFPRLSATLLAGSIVPTTLAAHRFWEYEDADERGNQLVQFLKNIGLLGGVILAAVDTAGRPSLGWRARHSAKELSKQTQDAVESARETVAKRAS